MIFYAKQDKAILLFHRVLPVRDPLWDPIDPALFADTLKYVNKHFHVVTLDEILFSGETHSSKPFAALTFDDGYRDFIDYAMPVLDEHKLKASMFVVTDCIDKGMPTWTYIMDHIFANSRKMEWKDFDVALLPETFRKTSWQTQEEKLSYCRKFKQHIKWIPANDRDKIIDSLVANFDDAEYPANMMMNWDQLRQIKTAGYEIGSHSVTHPSLATINDLDSIKFEFTESAKRIKEEIGTFPSTFSYPLGGYDERVKQIACETGYKAALAVNYKKYNPAKQDIYEVPRIELYSESWLKTKMRINGTFNYLKKIYK